MIIYDSIGNSFGRYNRFIGHERALAAMIPLTVHRRSIHGFLINRSFSINRIEV
jgi:hypothetical protein